MQAYEQQTGVRILPKFDVESTKTVGLTNLIIVEAVRPRCDLFWNNEILNTIRLKDKGLLVPFHPARAAELPDTFKAKDGTWYGFAARARVLLVNTRVVAEAERPRGIQDLLDPRWKGKIAIAKPLFGTTATHAACLFAAWGREKARTYFIDLKANGVQVLSGNKQVAQAVGSGQVAFGLTDTDDAMGELAAGSPVALVYPDRQEGELGTLFIPNTLAVIKGAPHPAGPRRWPTTCSAPRSRRPWPTARVPRFLSCRARRLRGRDAQDVHAMAVDFEGGEALGRGGRVPRGSIRGD